VGSGEGIPTFCFSFAVLRLLLNLRRPAAPIIETKTFLDKRSLTKAWFSKRFSSKKERWNGRDDFANQIILLTACQSLITLKNITPKIIFHVIETEQS
jgi:hypothetical protein